MTFDKWWEVYDEIYPRDRALAAYKAAQAGPPADNSAMDATKLREAFMAGRLSQACQIGEELAFSEFMTRRRHQ